MPAVKEFLGRGEVLLLVIYAAFWAVCHWHIPVIEGQEDHALLRSGMAASTLTSLWVLIYSIIAPLRDVGPIILLFVVVHIVVIICGYAATDMRAKLLDDLQWGAELIAGGVAFAGVVTFVRWRRGV